MDNLNNPILVFWWSESRLMGKAKENYGDLLSKYIVERLSGKEVKWIQPKKRAWYQPDRKNYFVCGSILSHVTKKSVVWGSGIIDEKHEIENCDFRAVRGPRTRKFLLGKGYDCPRVYGDPAILLPVLYKPDIEKKFKIGIIPHYNDYKLVYETYKNSEEIKVIDLMTLDIEKVTSDILQCEKIISSSLHGVIIAHAYGIPALWVEFSKNIFGSGIKYIDYLESVELPVYTPEFLKGKYKLNELVHMFGNYPNLPKYEKVRELQRDLLRSCPFKDNQSASNNLI